MSFSPSLLSVLDAHTEWKLLVETHHGRRHCMGPRPASHAARGRPSPGGCKGVGEGKGVCRAGGGGVVSEPAEACARYVQGDFPL